MKVHIACLTLRINVDSVRPFQQMSTVLIEGTFGKWLKTLLNPTQKYATSKRFCMYYLQPRDWEKIKILHGILEDIR